LVHDLHPLDTGARIRRALGRLGGGMELLGVDDAGVAHIRLGSGCGSTTAAVEQAIAEAAPETSSVQFAPREAPLLQITRRPAGAL
jgi:Fe-S cluster biogenesis protein NfuA